MHSIYFLQKRAHLCCVAVGRAMFKHIEDMTPARFDLLFVIYHYQCPAARKTYGYKMEERVLVKTLGLSRQTVWESVGRLVELGLLARTKEQRGAGRTNLLEITPEGLRRFKQALNAAFSERRPLPMDAPAVDPPRWWRRPELADPVTPDDVETTAGGLIIKNGIVTAEKKEPEMLGRDVEKIYTSWAWGMVKYRGGRRGRRIRHLEKLDELISFVGWMAQIVGNVTPSIYPFKYSEEVDH